MYDVTSIRSDFPILSREVYGKPLVYLDNGATTQKPLCVLDAMQHEYLNANANVHRGVHYLSQQATDLHEAARTTVRKFINARSDNEIIFTRGTTEGINLIASSFCEGFMQPGDEVIITAMEHHSNIVPWQLQAARSGIAIRVIPIDDRGELILDEMDKLFTSRTRLVSVMQVSNVLGTVNPVKEEWLEKLPPYQGGGEMIATVSFEKTTFAELPFKFEAGTPDYVATHGLATALDYLSALGMDNIQRHEQDLTRYATQQLETIDGMRFFGHSTDKDAVISFLIGDIHHLDLGTLLDRLGIAVRTGHHCAQPLMARLGISGTVRASFGLYNTREEIDALVAGVRRVAAMF